MRIKINGVEPLNVVDSISSVTGSTKALKKPQKKAADSFEKSLSPPSPFLKAQNSLKNDPILNIESHDIDPKTRWWTDELANFARAGIPENSYITPRIADELRSIAREQNYLLVNLAEGLGNS